MMTFDEWMAKVDAALVRLCGLDSRDLPDYSYRDAYDDGTPPNVVARLAVEYAGSC